GLSASKGDYLVFLDADDRLLPDALESGVECLLSRPECAFVYGHLQFIASDGSPRPTPRQTCVEKDHCLELLRTDYIWTPGVVMYRCTVFEFVIGFNTLISACADCDLNIRISRDFPVYCHGRIVLEYRQHSANMSRNAALMLRTALAAHHLQREYVKGNTQYEEAADLGRRAAQAYFGGKLIKEVRLDLASRDLKQAIQGMFILLLYHPQGFARYACESLSNVGSRAKNFLRI